MLQRGDEGEGERMKERGGGGGKEGRGGGKRLAGRRMKEKGRK